MPRTMKFTQAFRTGIRSDWRTEKGKDVLLDAQGLRVTEFGLKDVLPITDLSKLVDLSGLDTAWPYPEIVRGKNSFLMAYDHGYPVLIGINELVADGDYPWTATPLSVYQYDNWSTVVIITDTSMGQMHLAEAGNNIFIFTGNLVIFNSPGTSKMFCSRIMTGEHTYDEVTINTGCGFRDRQLLFGGFNKSNCYSLAKWDAFYHALGQPTGMVTDLGPNTVVWSMLAGLDIPDARMFFDSGGTYGLDELIYGTHPKLGVPVGDWGLSKPWILEQRKRGEFGSMNMPWRGMVQRILPIGQETGVIVYGDDGVTGLVPIKPGSPSWGRVDIANLLPGYGVGAGGRSMMCGDFAEHIFIGEDGVLWSVNEKFQATKVNDNKLFDLSRWSNPAKVRISKDTEQGEYRLVYNDGKVHDTFLLTRNGLIRANDSPTSISCYAEGRIGHLDTTTTPVIEWQQNWETNWFDGGMDDVWIVSQLSTDCPFWTFEIDYLRDSLADPNTDVQTIGPFSCDERGIANGLQVQGVLFKVRAMNYNPDYPTKAEELEVTIGRAGEEGKMKLRYLMP